MKSEDSEVIILLPTRYIYIRIGEVQISRIFDNPAIDWNQIIQQV